MKPLNIKWMIAILMTAASTHALAEPSGSGNGGGSWVCREPNQDIRWSKFVDLYEANKEELDITLAEQSGYYIDIVDRIRVRFSNANTALYIGVAPYLDRVNYLREHRPEIAHTRQGLAVINDALYHLVPNDQQCRGGNIKYEQVVNYKDDGQILVQAELFREFTETAKAAIVIHEGVYAYLRKSFHDTYSARTRAIVGLLFSNLSNDLLKQKLKEEILKDYSKPRSSIQAAALPSKQLFPKTVSSSGRCHFWNSIEREIRTSANTKALLDCNNAGMDLCVPLNTYDSLTNDDHCEFTTAVQGYKSEYPGRIAQKTNFANSGTSELSDLNHGNSNIPEADLSLCRSRAETLKAQLFSDCSQSATDCSVLEFTHIASPHCEGGSGECIGSGYGNPLCFVSVKIEGVALSQ